MTTVKRRIHFCACREMFYAWMKNDEIFQHESCFSLSVLFFWNVHNVMHTKKKTFAKKKGKGVEIEIRNL